jgi:hypothetical protein
VRFYQANSRPDRIVVSAYPWKESEPLSNVSMLEPLQL